MSDKPRLYYIQDTRQVVGNCALWWRAGGAGYTCDLDDAGTWPEDDLWQFQRATDVPHLKSEVDAIAIRHARGETLREMIDQRKSLKADLGTGE